MTLGNQFLILRNTETQTNQKKMKKYIKHIITAIAVLFVAFMSYVGYKVLKSVDQDTVVIKEVSVKDDSSDKIKLANERADRAEKAAKSAKEEAEKAKKLAESKPEVNGVSEKTSQYHPTVVQVKNTWTKEMKAGNVAWLTFPEGGAILCDKNSLMHNGRLITGIRDVVRYKMSPSFIVHFNQQDIDDVTKNISPGAGYSISHVTKVQLQSKIPKLTLNRQYEDNAWFAVRHKR